MAADFMIIPILWHLLATCTCLVSAHLKSERDNFDACIPDNHQKKTSHHYMSMLQVGIGHLPIVPDYQYDTINHKSGKNKDQKAFVKGNVPTEALALETVRESTIDLANRSMRFSAGDRKECACQGPIPPQANCTCPLDKIKAAVKQHVDIVKEIVRETAGDIEDVIAEEDLKRILRWDIFWALFSCMTYFILPRLWVSTALLPPAQGADEGLPLFFPALHSLRYCVMVALLLKQIWLNTFFNTSEFYILLSGFVLEFAEQRRTSKMEGIKDVYRRIIPRRFARLYPLYALSVIIAFLRQDNHSTCDPIKSLLLSEAWGCGAAIQVQDQSGAWHLKPFACGEGTWFVSVIFGCYLLFPLLSAPMRYLQMEDLSKLWACCVLLIVVPRALGSTAHAHNIWWSDVFHPQQQEVGVFALRFSQRSVLHGLAYFFSGIILARTWVIVQVQSAHGAAEQLKTTSFMSQLIRTLSRYGCMIAFAMLTAWWYFTTMRYPESKSLCCLMRVTREVWLMVGLSCLILGAAGEYGVSSTAKRDPIYLVLCIPSFAWMGELALPMYLSSSWTCDFAQHLASQHGIPVASDFAKVVLFLVAANVGALILYGSCGALASHSEAGKSISSDR